MTKSTQLIDISFGSCQQTFFNLFNCCAMLVIILIECSLLQPVVSGINHNDYLAQLKVPQCRKDCLDKFSSDDLACLQKLDCSICDFAPYQFHSFPDAINLMCWNNCAPRSPSASVVHQNPADVVPATKPSDSSDLIQLSIRSMAHDGSLTMADIVWYADDPDQHQCLVTWEVFGGGIMGNLLTDTHEAELSLWPDSKYHIQVTCKNKNTNKMSKSLPILIDTANAQRQTTTTMKTLRPQASSSSEFDANNENTETERPPFISSHEEKIDKNPPTTTRMTTITVQSTPSESSDDNDRHATKTIDGFPDDSPIRKHHEFNNNNRHQITAKPMHDAQHTATETSRHQNDKKNSEEHSMHTIASSMDGVKIPKTSTTSLSSSSSSSNTAQAGAATAKIRHSDIETTLTVFICTIVSIRHRRKSKKHCDKSNLISGSSSVSCSSTTINDCEMDLSGSTVCITQTTAIHV